MGQWRFFICIFLSVQYVVAHDDAYTTQLHEYMVANYYHFLGNKTASAAWYSSISMHADGIHTYRGYLHFLQDMGKYKDIIQLQSKIDTHFAKDKDLQKILIAAYEKVGNKQEAQTRLVRIQQQEKDDPEIAFSLAQMYMEQKEPENALTTIDQFLNTSIRRTHGFIFYFLKAQIYLSLHDRAKALENVGKCLELQSHFDKGWLLFAILHEEAGDIVKAVQGYNSYLEVTDQPQQQIRQHALALALKHKISQDKVPTASHQRSDLEQIFVLMNQKQYKQALVLAEQCIRKEPQSIDAHMIKITILYHLHDLDNLIKAVEHAINLDPSQIMWYKITHLLAQQEQCRDKAYKLLETAYSTHHQLWAALYGADIALRAYEYNAAYSFLKNTIATITDTGIKKKVLFILSTLAHELGEYSTMKSCLDELLVLDPNHVPALNNYAYYYATKGKDIVSAEQYLAKAATHDPENPFILDTKATILYKKKEYHAAQKILELLTAKLPDNAMVWTHLALVHYKVGNNAGLQACTQHAQLYAKYPYECQKVKKLHTLLARRS